MYNNHSCTYRLYFSYSVYLRFGGWIIWLSMMVSNCIQLVAKDNIPFFMAEWYILSHLLDPVIHWWASGKFHFLANTNWVAINMEIQITLICWFHFLCVKSQELNGLGHMVDLFWDPQGISILSSMLQHFTSHQHWIRVPFSCMFWLLCLLSKIPPEGSTAIEHRAVSAHPNLSIVRPDRLSGTPLPWALTEVPPSNMVAMSEPEGENSEVTCLRFPSKCLQEDLKGKWELEQRFVSFSGNHSSNHTHLCKGLYLNHAEYLIYAMWHFLT